MNILIATNSFKSSLSSSEACDAIKYGIIQSEFNAMITCVPLSDGGQGTADLLATEKGFEAVFVDSLDPLHRKIKAKAYYNETTQTGLTDIATASGIELLKAPQELRPYEASSHGTGMVVRQLIQKGASSILMGLGGSATIDLGFGILAGLGFQLIDDKRRRIHPGTRHWLFKIHHIVTPHSLPETEFVLLCDVNAPFLGPKGAIHLYGTQKGIPKNETHLIEKKYILLSDRLKKIGIHLNLKMTASGAAGGVASGIKAFFHTQLYSGADYLLDTKKIEEKIMKADLVVTGEGKYDEQSIQGKLCYKMLILAKKHQKKILLIDSSETKPDLFDYHIRLPLLPLELSKERRRVHAENIMRQSVNQFFSSFLMK
jgi:glycerate 2-kinase